MTLLDDVEQLLRELENIGDVVIVKKEEHGYLLDGNPVDRYGHRVDFWIASVNGLYSANELQLYMEKLVSAVPGMECSERFREESGRVYFGRGEGVERILKGEVDTLQCYAHAELPTVERRIRLKLFPDEHYVEKVIPQNLQWQYGCVRAYLERNKLGQRLGKVA